MVPTFGQFSGEQESGRERCGMGLASTVAVFLQIYTPPMQAFGKICSKFIAVDGWAQGLLVDVTVFGAEPKASKSQLYRRITRHFTVAWSKK